MAAVCGVPLAAGDLEDRAQHVREGLVGTEDPEIPLVGVERGHIAEELAQHQGVLGVHRAGGGHVHGMGPEIGHAQVAEQDAAVGVRVGAHPPLPLGRETGEFGQQPARLIE